MSSDSSVPVEPPLPPTQSGVRLPREQGMARVLPIVLGLLFVFGAMSLGHRQAESERRALSEATDAAVREVHGALAGRIGAQIDAIERLKKRWDGAGGLEKPVFDVHAGALIRDFKYVRAIQWIDAAYVIRWSASLDGAESVIGTQLGSTPAERAEFDWLSDRSEGSISPPIDLLSGDRGFVIVFPLFPDGVFNGFVVAVYEAQPMVSALLEHVSTGFDIEISGATGPLWDRNGLDSNPRYVRTGRVDLLNQTWTLSVAPGPELVGTYLTPMPFVLGGGGTLVGFLLGYTLSAAWLGYLRNERLRQANAKLTGEITRRTRAEEAEQEARDELEAVVNSLPVYVWSAVVGPDGEFRFRYQSQFIESITGRPARDFSKRLDWIGLIHLQDRARMIEVFDALARGDLDEDSSEYRFVRADGDERRVRQHVRVRVTHEGRCLDGVTLDFTDLQRAEDERAALEARMHETQRLDSLGGLAGGIAHDFNNLLVAMLGHASLAREDLPADAPAHRSLESIERAARRAADLCRQMLAYAGMGSVIEERIDLREVVRDIGDLLRASIPRTTEFDIDLGAMPAGVEADPSQLRQVVLNLITNAAESIGAGGGCIAMRVETRSFDAQALEGFLLGETLHPGRFVAFTVSDDGCGMDAETRRRIFEPFFTTKFQGRGLGLAAVLGIVRRCAGGLLIESEPGEGTSITVLLRPVELVRPTLEQPPLEVEVSASGGKILLVEDDEGAREFAATVLERAGFEVVQAADGVEAMECFEKHAHEIRCVVLDLTMPRMDGVEAARRLRAMSPGLALVLCSGYPEDDAMKRFGVLGIASFLQKPYAPQRLVACVQTALDESARNGSHLGDAPG